MAYSLTTNKTWSETGEGKGASEMMDLNFSTSAAEEGRRAFAKRCFDQTVLAESIAVDCELANYFIGYMAYKMAAFAWGLAALRGQMAPLPPWLDGFESQLRLMAMLRPEIFGDPPEVKPESDPNAAESDGVNA